MTADRTLLLTDDHLAPVWNAIHDRLCSGADPASLSTLKVAGLSNVGIATLRTWLDATRRRRGTSVATDSAGVTSVPVRELLRVLGMDASELPSFVEQAVGRPIVDRAAARRQATALRTGLWTYAAEKLPALPRLVHQMRVAGVGDDDLPTRQIVDAIAATMARLPSDPPVALAKLAHDCADRDPHFFDLDQLAGRRLVSAVAELTGAEVEPTRPDRVRALLASVGIIADRLSATVLLHNVRVCGDGPIDRRLRDSPTPVALHLLDLTRTPPKFASQVLTVVENPSVLEAAMTTGSHHAIVVTSGHLGSVDHALLQLAHDQGLVLRYSGDVDGPGLQIASAVVRDYGAELIAMDAATVAEAGGAPLYQENDLMLEALLAPPP